MAGPHMRLTHMRLAHSWSPPQSIGVRWVLTEGPDKRHRIAVGAVAKPTKDDPKPRKGEEMVKLPPQWPGEQSEANVTWPVIVRLRHTAFTSEDEAKAMLAKWEENMEKATKETESGDARHGGHDKETESRDAKHGGQDAATESGDTKDGGQDGASTEQSQARKQSREVPPMRRTMAPRRTPRIP